MADVKYIFNSPRFHDANLSNCMAANIMRAYKMVKRYWPDRKVEWTDRQIDAHDSFNLTQKFLIKVQENH